MVAAVHHGSNLITGTWIDEDLGVYVGWTARKGSSSDTMPLRNESGDVILTISGEEFAEPETLRRLTARGHAVDKEGLSYLVHLYEEDSSFPAALNGRFHGLLADRRRQTALLFNDRYGMHRIYYHESAEAFYFAAEAKAILAVRPELRQIDPRGMGELVTCGCVLENRTLFSGIQVLPPAAAWAFRNGAIERKGAYFEPREWEEQAPLEPETYYQELRDVFSRRLPRYFNGRERVGMSLTGGLDTRMIMAWQRFPEGSLPCYSFGSMFRDCQDVVLARQVARACGQTHQVIPVEDEFLDHFPTYAERAVYLTDGCVNVAHAPDLYVGERAAEIAPVRMTGNYGGEVLRRVRAFKPIKPAPSLFAGEFLPQVDLAEATYHELRHVHPLSFAVFRQAPWHHYGLLSLEQTQVSLRSPFLDNDFVRTVFRAPQLAYANNDVSIRLIGDGNPALARIQTDRGLLTARNGLQARALQKFIHLTVKAEYAYDYGMPHWVSRVDNLLSPLRLERLFLGRHKFYHFRVWYRRALAGYVREMLLDPRTLSRPYLRREAVESMVRGHLSGGRNYTSEIHKLLTLELVHRSFVDSH
jgi:asparagine synthase (glutamine-hydrolysing)